MDDYEWRRPTAREVATGTKWVIGSAALALVLVLTIGAMWMLGVGWFQRATADFRGETAALEQILADPDRRISAYDHFFRLCASIQGHEDTIRALRTELGGDPSDSRREQIQGAVTANRSQRDTKIRQYNADAARGYTVGQFRDANLPDQLDITSEETECATAS